jgi:hypothetical protein
MQVKHLIATLKKYNPDDEIIVAYWDKAWFSDMTNREISDEQWPDIVHDGDDVIDNMDIGEYLQLAAVEILDAEITNDND